MIGDVITRALPALREQAESLMVDTAVIDKPDQADAVWDPALEQMVLAKTVVYDGPARLIRSGTGTSATDAAGEDVSVSPYIVALPWDVTASIGDGDRVVVAGVELRIQSIRTGTHRIELRLLCTEYT